MPWDSSGDWKQGNGNSFIFSLREDSNFVKLKSLNKSKEVYHEKSWLCSFGNSDGIIIKGENNNYSELGYRGWYELP